MVSRLMLLIVALVFLFCGCQPTNQKVFVVEDNTPIVNAGVTTEALGIETLGGVFTPLIKEGTKTPYSLSEIFSTAADGQSHIMVTLFRGTNQLTSSNHALGQYQVVGIPSAPRGTPKVKITFAVTERQILLSARDANRRTSFAFEKVSENAKP